MREVKTRLQRKPCCRPLKDPPYWHAKEPRHQHPGLPPGGRATITSDRACMRALIALLQKKPPISQLTHPSAHMADIPMLQTATVGSATGCLFPSHEKKSTAERTWQGLVAVECRSRTVRMESKELAGPEQDRTCTMPAQWKREKSAGFRCRRESKSKRPRHCSPKMQPRITPSYRKGEKKQGALNVNRLSNVTDPGRLEKGSSKKKDFVRPCPCRRNSPEPGKRCNPTSR